MKYSVLKSLVFVVLLAACSSGKDENTVPLTSGLLKENMDTTVNPGDNFQMYVNGTWIKNTEIPADKASYGIGYIIHEKSQDDVKKIIEEAAAAGKEFGTDEQKVGDLYASFLDMEKRNTLGTAPLAPEFEKIDAIKDSKGLAEYFGYANIYGYGSPFGLFIVPDFKKPTEYALYCWQSGLGLPDREYYLDPSAKQQEIRKAYVEHMAIMLDLGGVKNGKKLAKDIMALETAMASKHMKKEETRDMARMYNMYPVDSLDQVMGKFDFKAFLAGSKVPLLDRLVIGQPSFVLAMNDLAAGTSLDTWKAYLKWNVINAGASLLNTAMDEQNFKFYGKTLTGRIEQRPAWRRGVDVVNGNLGEVVGKVYVEKHFPTEAKERMTALVGNLIEAYRMSINELDWMGAETKMQALDKLSKFTPKIGYPDKWKDYSAVTIKKDNLFGNIQSAKLATHNQELAKIGKPIDKTEWGMTPQTVNAYYDPTKNEIVFPAAILQPPFFDLHADDAVNYGAIGAVIGHEIGHGFDDQGSTFTGDGELKNWWTDKDKEEFKKRTEALVAQYSAYKVFPDLNVNGEFTQGENIGDLGGLGIALKAYKMSLKGKDEPMMDGFTGTQRVFLGYAQAWRGKSREQALRMQINTDPHSPGVFRVNGVVRNIPEFYDAFGIKPTDTLYLAPGQRVKIW
ncbi:MAG: M13 family metallopeptidase [Cytophagales bacterium]|nr:M13 family metallopeptidase [Cytophagales bacterium]